MRGALGKANLFWWDVILMQSTCLEGDCCTDCGSVLAIALMGWDEYCSDGVLYICRTVAGADYGLIS